MFRTSNSMVPETGPQLKGPVITPAVTFLWIMSQ